MTSAADELEELAPDETAEGAQPIDAPGGSELSLLRDRVRKAKARRFDLQVPGLEPPVFVRYRAVERDAMEKVFAKTEPLRKDRTVISNAIILADNCEGVFELDEANLDESGKPRKVSVDPDDRDGPWPKFEPRLARLLGEPMVKKAVDVVRLLYPFDGDVISTAQDLSVRSGYAREQTELESEGN